ncbi:MAG: FtsX-like permease family protein, partial [Candidatus Hodarchaeales archaeon]
MFVTYRFLIEFIFRSIYKNFIRSSTIIITTILVLSSGVALLGWIEISPTMVIDNTFSERGYEIEVTQIFFNPENFPRLQLYLETEELVKSSTVTHPSIFLYNLNNRNPDFNVLNDPRFFDFYMTTDLTNFVDGVYFVSQDYITNIKPMLELEADSKLSFNENNKGIVISRRLLNLIEEYCDDSYSVGDKIDFLSARSHLPGGTAFLGSLLPLAFSNMTINAIYDRIPVGGNPLEYTFYQETLGDGVFLSKELLNQSNIDLMEENGLFPTLFVELNKDRLPKIGTLSRVVPEIENIASRITGQGFYYVNTQNEEIRTLLDFYDRSQLVVFFLLLPLVIISEILFLVLVRRLINDQTLEKFKYLHLRGNSDNQIFFIEFGEFFILNLIGLIGGLIGGFIFIDVLLSTSNFLNFSNLVTSLGSGFETVLKSGATIFIIGIFAILFLNFTYFYYRFMNLISSLQELEATEPADSIGEQRNLNRNSLILILSCLGVFILFRTLIPEILSTLGFTDVSLQLIPIILIILLSFWIIFSFFSPQYLLLIFQSAINAIPIFKHPRKKLTWLSLLRRKTHYLSLMALLALTVSLTSFSLVYYESLQTNSVKNAAYLTGADLKVITDSTEINPLKAQIEQVEGVVSVLGFSQFQIYTASRYIFVLIGINPEAYYEISPVEENTIVDGPLAEDLWHSMDGFNAFSSVIIGRHIAEVFQWEVGSNIETLGFPGYNARYDLSVRAIIDSAPGIGPLQFTDKLGSFDCGGYALVHEDLLSSFGVNEATTFLVRTETPSDGTEAIIDEIRNLDPAVRGVFTSDFYLSSNQQFLRLAGVQGILSLNCIGMVLINLIGISTMYQCLLDERMTEFAVFRTLGATKQGITRIMIKESSLLSTISISIGVISGLLFGIGFLITSRGVTLPPHSAFLLELMIPLALLAASIILVIGIVLIVNLVYVK